MTADQHLTTEDLGRLALLSQLVSTSPLEHRSMTIAMVIDLVGQYRDKGSWPEIATALGITPSQLREWRVHAASATKPHDLQLPPKPPVSPRRNKSVLLIITGHPNAQPGQTNDFTTETAAIRDRCDTRFIVKEIAGIGLSRITHALDDHEPDILHVVAHSEQGDVFLTDSAEPVPMPRSVFADAITRTPWRPTLIVLNVCSSIDIAHRLATNRNTVIGWPSQLLDRQAREFAQTLYRELDAGQTLGTAFDDAEITIARWPDLHKPRLIGARSARFA